MDNLFATNHPDNISNSQFNTETNRAAFWSKCRRFVSSANNAKYKLSVQLTTLLMCSKKSIGLKIDPCGTPQITEQ